MKSIPSSLVHKVAPLATQGPGPYPALILVHGRGSNEDDLLSLVASLDPRLFVISVRAPLAFPYGGFTWYSMEEVGRPEPAEFMESHNRLVQFLQEVRSFYPVDPERLFLLGFSMGSVMSLGLGLSRPSEIRGVVAHSGYIPEHSGLRFDSARITACRFFVAHGVDDPVIPIPFGRRANAILTEQGADFTYKEYRLGHSMSEESVRDFSHWLTETVDGGSRP